MNFLTRVWWDQLWVIGRRSARAYIRLYPNPGFMLPWFGGRRLRWSWHHGLMVTLAPTPDNPRGLTAKQREAVRLKHEQQRLARRLREGR